MLKIQERVVAERTYTTTTQHLCCCRQCFFCCNNYVLRLRLHELLLYKIVVVASCRIMKSRRKKKKKEEEAAKKSFSHESSKTKISLDTIISIITLIACFGTHFVALVRFSSSSSSFFPLRQQRSSFQSSFLLLSSLFLFIINRISFVPALPLFRTFKLKLFVLLFFPYHERHCHHFCILL